jgi:hypothetical protein
MIIRQTLNFGVNLVAGAIVGALAVAAMRACWHAGRDRLEPRHPPAPEPPTPAQPGESPGGAAAI